MRLFRAGLMAFSVVAACTVLGQDAAAQKRNRDLITREEILASAHKDSDLFQAVRSLRAHFLAGPRGVRTLGGAPPSPTALYVDGNKMGELDGLRVISAMHVLEVRYLDPSRAENEFGIGHSGGAVMVKLFKAPKPDTVPPG